MKRIGPRSISVIILTIGAVLHLLYFIFISSPSNRTLYNFYTFIGGYISAAGIIFTIIQLKSVREEAEAIKNSVSNYNNILTLVEVSNLSGLLAEARGHIITQDIKTAHQKLSFLKPSIITLSNRVNKQNIIFEREKDAPELKDLIFSFRNDIQNLDESIYNEDSFKNINFSIILKNTDDLLVYFLHLAEHLKSHSNES